eukprot:scaffold7522_cov202-Skeletonema_marinoi.AAC.15
MLGGLGNKFNYTGAEVIPCHATHITVAVKVIPENAFRPYTFNSIIEVICGDEVEKVEGGAFDNCSSLRRVIMPNVEVVEYYAFCNCVNLTDVECGKLEIIENNVFHRCNSLRSINLPSARIVRFEAFANCPALTDVTFGNKLEKTFGESSVFMNCRSLERITIPLKDGMLIADDIFTGCDNFKQVDLVEGPIHETIAALPMEEWRNDMHEEINSINHILPTVSAGSGWEDEVAEEEDREYEDGEKARAIRTWIKSVIRKIIHYQAEHQRYLNEEIATTLPPALPRDIVINNVLPFLDLPSHTFELVDHEEEVDDSVREEEVEEDEQGDDNAHSDDDFDDDGNASLEGDGSRKRRRMEYHA